MAPCTFLEPAYSPRSSCATWGRRRASVRAAAFPAMPAPTTIASNLSSIIAPFSLAGDPVAGMGREAAAEGLGQRRHQWDRIGDDAEMGEIEDWRILVGVDGDDQIGAFYPHAVLDCAGDPRRDVELRPDGLPGLPDLAIGGNPALLDQWTRAAILGAEDAGELAHQLEIFRRSEAEPARDHDVGIGKT